MRTVERKINNIVNDMQACKITADRRPSKRDYVAADNGNVYAYLWGTLIAQVTEGTIALYSGGYRTPTTKSRLNALLRLTGRPLYVYQKNFKWFVHDSQLGESCEFFDGIAFFRAN